MLQLLHRRCCFLLHGGQILNLVFLISLVDCALEGDLPFSSAAPKEEGNEKSQTCHGTVHAASVCAAAVALATDVAK